MPPLIFLKKPRFLKKLALCLDKDTARHSPRLRKKTQRVASAAQQKSGALSFSGLGRAGRGETPFSFAQTQDSKKLENIRENAILRNLESIDSLDSARLVLAHALLFIFGKASHKFFEVGDSVVDLDSMELDSESFFRF